MGIKHLNVYKTQLKSIRTCRLRNCGEIQGLTKFKLSKTQRTECVLILNIIQNLKKYVFINNFTTTQPT